MKPIIILGLVLSTTIAFATAPEEVAWRKNRLAGGPAILFNIGGGVRASYERMVVTFLGLGAGLGEYTSFFTDSGTTAMGRATYYLPVVGGRARAYLGLGAGYMTHTEHPFFSTGVTYREEGFAAEVRPGFEFMFTNLFGMALDSTIVVFKNKGFYNPGVEFLFYF